jgi:hypothetical protein
MKNSVKKLVLTTQSILKFMHFRRKTIICEIITYIGAGVGIRVVPQRSSLGHEAQPGEVAFLLLVVDLLILFWTWWVFVWEVEVAQCCTCSGHDLHDVLFLLISEAILLLVVVLVVVIILVGVVVLLPLRAVNDKVGGVAALEAAPGVLGVSSPLLPKLVHHLKFLYKQGNLIIKNALVLLIRSYSNIRQNKLQKTWDSVGGVSIMATNTSTSNKNFTSKVSIMIRMTFMRQFMRPKLAKQFSVSKVAKSAYSFKALIFIPHTWSSRAYNNYLAC